MGQQADGTGPAERGASPPPAGRPSAWVMAFAAAGAAAGGLAGALRGRRSTKPAAAQEASVAKAEMDEPVTDENGRQGGGEPEAEAHAESSDDVYDASAEGEDEQEEEPLVNDASPPAEEEEPDAGPDPAPAEEDDPEPAHAQTSSADDSRQRGGLSRILSTAKEELAEATGYEVEAVSGLRRDDGSWHLTVEVLELERIPRSTDVLASYQVVVDDDGELLSWERVRRYYRNQAEDQGSE